LRFTVHRPPCGEVSLRWYRPPGGDVACSVHVGIARPRFAGDAREDRLALAVFGGDVPTSGASLRRVRSRNPFESSGGLVVKPGNQPTPGSMPDRAVEAPLLRNLNTRVFNRTARGASHRPYVEGLDPNRVEPARKISRGLLHPIVPPIRFARFDSGNRHLGALSAIGSALGSRKALLQPAQPTLLTRCQARSVQQLAGGQRRRYRHTPIDTDHAAIGRPRDRGGDAREPDVPAPGPIPRDAIGLHTRGHGSRPAEPDPPNLRHPHPPIAPVELFDMARLDPDLAETFMHTGLAPRRAPIGAGEKAPHGLRKIPQRLLLDRLRPGPQPVVFGTDLGQLRRLLVIPRGAAPRLPQLLLLHRQIPHKPGMPAMLQQHHLLSRCRQQTKPRHIRKVATATDTNRHCSPRRPGSANDPDD
jgi:hypothetical protein